jgi:hypothetical protein
LLCVYYQWLNKKLSQNTDLEMFDLVFEAKVLVKFWQREYNQIRSHSSLEYVPIAQESMVPLLVYVSIRLRLAPPNNYVETNLLSGIKTGGRSQIL